VNYLRFANRSIQVPNVPLRGKRGEQGRERCRADGGLPGVGELTISREISNSHGRLRRSRWSDMDGDWEPDPPLLWGSDWGFSSLTSFPSPPPKPETVPAFPSETLESHLGKLKKTCKRRGAMGSAENRRARPELLDGAGSCSRDGGSILSSTVPPTWTTEMVAHLVGVKIFR
jgi:hypothetical protein